MLFSSIAKANVFFNTFSANFSKTEIILINCLFELAKQGKLKISISNLKHILNLNTRNTKWIVSLFECIMKPIGLETTTGITGAITPLAAFAYRRDKSDIFFEIPESTQAIINNPKSYTRLNLAIEVNFKSKYTVILYEYLKSLQSIQEKNLREGRKPVIPAKIDKMMKLFGVNYKRSNDFITYAVKVAIEEINAKSDINVTFEPKRKSRKYDILEFTVIQKPLQKPKIENTSKPIRNQHVDSGPAVKKKEYAALPADIISVIPEKWQINPVIETIQKHISKPKEIIESNIKYAASKSKDNFSAYLAMSLKNDYAAAMREIETKRIKLANNKIEIARREEQRQRQEKAAVDETLTKFNNLPADERESYIAEATATQKVIANGNKSKEYFLLRPLAIEAKAIEIFASKEGKQ